MIKDMEKRNYQKELDTLVLAQMEYPPSVLLHSCCGPCSSSVLEYLTKYFRVTLLWYNPNLYPESEFYKRLATQKELLNKMELSSKVDIMTESWKHEDFISAAIGYENEPEGGKRCEQCFSVRLRECARLAKENNFDYYCTTLTVSRYKNAPLINSLGEEIGKETGIRWLPSDFKKKGGEQRSAELAKYYQLYRQVYCGCEYSLIHRNNAKKQKFQE
jgi:predicted adenine nucleotide alpha hydrolase (AANH) superfamily ATPase